MSVSSSLSYQAQVEQRSFENLIGGGPPFRALRDCESMIETVLFDNLSAELAHEIGNIHDPTRPRHVATSRVPRCIQETMYRIQKV